MRKLLDSALNQIKTFFTKLTKKDKIRLSVLLAVIIVLSVVVAAVLGRTNYAVLYSGLSEAQSGEILLGLDSMGVNYKLEGTNTILVPEGSVSELRIRLTSEGYVSSSGGLDPSVYYGLASGFGVSDSERQTYYKYQLQYDLRETILKTEKVKDCLVLLNLQEESTFALSSKEDEASASVILELYSGVQLSNSEATAIAMIVSAGVAIPQENIRVMDTKMKVYSTGGETDGASAYDYQYQLQDQVREQLERQVVNLLSPVFGYDSVTASVGVTLNFDSETVQSVEFEPPVEGETEGIAVSMYELYEYTRSDTYAGVTGTDSNGMGTVEYPYDTDEGLYYSQIVREVNYEINETRTQIERGKGTISRLSIAVILNSEAITEDYTSNVRNLVAAALGINEEYISIERLPFLTGENSFVDALDDQNTVMNDIRMKEIIQTIINGIVLLLLVLSVISFLKTLVKGFSRRPQAAALATAGGGIDYVAGEPESDHYSDIELNSKAEGLGQLEKFIDRDPEAVAQLLRNWLTED